MKSSTCTYVYLFYLLVTGTEERAQREIGDRRPILTLLSLPPVRGLFFVAEPLLFQAIPFLSEVYILGDLEKYGRGFPGVPREFSYRNALRRRDSRVGPLC